MDEKFVETAEAVQEAVIKAGIKRAGNKQQRPVDFDGACRCGKTIPEGRIALGYFNCIECQTAIEGKR